MSTVSVINGRPRPSPVYHTNRPGKLTLPGTISRCRDMVDTNQNLNGSRDLITPFPWASTYYRQPTKFDVSIYTQYADMKGDRKRRTWCSLG